ncbi:hypothetical protein [Brevundimonas sp.]|uniref:hypothetical protein n=1 Tax=Brevundimonas sp. TaxID=1871086 RepID=UPI0025FB7AD5|nr:hypothetical protein [Brevundimonas sp.]
MARGLLLLGGAAALLFAAQPAAAQESAREAGLRYLTWPGRPPVQQTRPEPQRPRRLAPPRVQTEVETPPPPPPPVTQPVPRLSAPTVPASATVESPTPRYYSVHRAAGRQPDPIPQAGERAASDGTQVVLAVPSGRSLAEQDRLATAQEAMDILRDLPPDQLAQLLEQPR